MGKYRMYEPYGYDEEQDYLSRKAMLYNEVMKNRANDEQEFLDIDTLYNKHNTEVVASAYYDKELESVVFKNINGDAIESIRMTDIIPSKLVKQAEYDTERQMLVIVFDNDDRIEIDLNDIINKNEAGDGLKLDGNKFSVKIAESSEKFVSGSGESFLTVTSSGVAINHIQEAVDLEKERALEAERVEREARIEKDNVLLQLINSEKARAESEEARIETKLDNEIADRNTHNNEHDAAIAHLQSALQNEVIARGNAISAEASTRSRAISDEATARANADSVLRSAISSLESRVAALENEISSLRARVAALEA